MRSTNITEAKAKLSHIVEDVRTTREIYRIIKGGEIVAVLMSLPEYEELLETLDVLSDPALMKQIRASRRGGQQWVSHEDVFGEAL
jgi:prevent-host-death family protein